MRATLVGARLLPRSSGKRLRAMLARLGAKVGVSDRRIGVLFTDDAGIREYNARHRGRDEATDVLSFEAGSDGERGYLGDLVISVETARAQAADAGHGLEAEIEVLLLHGVLHLLGHDHERDSGEMRALERQLAVDVLGARRGLVDRSMSSAESGGRARPSRRA